MAVLNITTNKTRAQMVTELTAWADGTKIAGYDYVWSCADSINVTADIDISGFTLIFVNTKRIQAQAGGTINVSNDFVDRYNYPTKIIVSQGSDDDTEMVAGTGKWVGKGLTITMSGGNVRFNSSTSQTNLQDLSVDAIAASVSALRVLIHAAGEINLYRVTGMTVIRYAGILSMNPHGAGIISSQSFGPAKIVAASSTFHGFVISSDSTHRTQTASSAYNATTMTFIDGQVNPEFLDAYPKDNDGVIRLIKRTLKLQPKNSVQAQITAFNYRVLSKRVVQPGSHVTDNQVIVSNATANYGDDYLATVWRGVRATGSGGYNPLRDQTIDKELTVKFRKYGFNEAEYKTNSYFFADNAATTLETDEFVKDATPILANATTAAQFYDGIRSIMAVNMSLPEDLLTTDGVTLTIKSGWSLSYNTVGTDLVILSSVNKILLGKDSYIGKMNTGKFRYSRIAGSVADGIDGHTNLIYAKSDGTANLQLAITCPNGSRDPVAGVWLFSQGLDNRAGMITGQTTGTGATNITLSVSATAKYYCTAKALGSNQYVPFIIEPVGGLGASKEISLFAYENSDGTPLLPATLTPAQTAVANTLDFHGTHIDIKIPTDFSTNSRWSSTDKIWQYKAEDFIPIAYKLDVIQTALILLGRNQLIYLQEGRILVSASANAKILEQDPDNKTIVSSSTNIKVSFTTISIGRIGDTDARNTFIDDTNGTIDVRGGVPINGGFSPADAIRLTESHKRLGMDNGSPLTSKDDSSLLVGTIVVNAVTQADGSVKQTRAL